MAKKQNKKSKTAEKQDAQSKIAEKQDTKIEAFSKLSKEEQLRRENMNTNKKKKSMTVASRLMLFFVLPLFAGLMGLVSSFVQNKYGKNPQERNFDRDFIFPFLATLVLVIVVSVQTMNFSTYKAEPLVSWPKVVKKKKVIRKTIVVDDDGNVIEDNDEILKNLKETGEENNAKPLELKKNE
mmetsp:Transcript_1539/g.2821  ORF Transcript_1539/g.2821 Transcript_1539/m.2821 type:complete len:182 (-) Transcript_1539:115-660(-)|eukprot:CAMPEP_0176483004 /NCGR_PEP_ID=MMETSP0200_2-20121128/3690_1 /TAXON_ID=947934 /ORGANISM="Chaetoceros sp., Strain GSL56" /LENGTH=181 /DNA_ID=CAMNT_0017879383 /DNA_START=98 /DNA_END=643 /DNA_ORIENTATION=-